MPPAADRLLICSRCLARWPFDQIMCPFCRNAERSRITSFTSRDGHYRLSACDVCERYLKAYDARRASRPVMPAVDSNAGDVVTAVRFLPSTSPRSSSPR